MGNTHAIITTRYVDYDVDGTTFEGYVAMPEGEGPFPCLLLAHAWDGQNEHIRAYADEFAGKGILAFALDAYGKGVRGGVLDDNSELMNPLLADRAMLRDRLLGALAAMRAIEEADCNRVAAFGLCFGGLCVLDLARSGTKDLHGAISVHGVLTGPDLPSNPIAARLLLLHGWEDPVAPPQDVVALGAELNAANAQWEMRIFGDAMHAFTLEEANMAENGILYNARAASQTKLAIDEFLAEIFGT